MAYALIKNQTLLIRGNKRKGRKLMIVDPMIKDLSLFALSLMMRLP
jgi:hypothetical protein